MGKSKGTLVMSLSPQDAKREAIALVARLLMGDDVASEIKFYEEFFTGKAYATYMNQLFSQLREVAKKNDPTGSLHESSGRHLKQKPLQRERIDGLSYHTWTVPISSTIPTQGGFVIRFTPGNLHETSTETSIEVYAEASGGGEVSIGVTDGPINVKIGGGYKEGEKRSERTATRRMQRKTKTIEKTLNMILVNRNVIQVEWWTYVPEETVVLGRFDWTNSQYTLRNVYRTKQLGYKVVAEPGDVTIGYFWPHHRGPMTNRQQKESAMQNAHAEIKNQITAFGEEAYLWRLSEAQ